jgi:hypothetical protein
VGVVTGARGAVRWSYHLAASLGAFSITQGAPPECRLTLVARIEDHHPYRLAQTPLVFELLMPSGPPVRYAIRSLSVEGSMLTAILNR